MSAKLKKMKAGSATQLMISGEKSSPFRFQERTFGRLLSATEVRKTCIIFTCPHIYLVNIAEKSRNLKTANNY